MKKVIFAVCVYLVFFGPANTGVMRFYFLSFVAIVLIAFELNRRAEAKKMKDKKAYQILQMKELEDGKVSAVLVEDSSDVKFQKVFTTWPPEGFPEVISMGRVLLIPTRRV